MIELPVFPGLDRSADETDAPRVLVACECSGIVREAFRARGFNAWSCDLQPPEDGSAYHIPTDVRRILDSRWDLMIAHPPCTHLAVSGAQWFKGKEEDQEKDLAFFRELLDAPIEHIAIENPVSIAATRIRKSDQTVQPWQYGHGEVKRTCLWLKNLPLLKPTNIVAGREERVRKMGRSNQRARERARTYPGIAEAFADQWGDHVKRVIAMKRAGWPV